MTESSTKLHYLSFGFLIIGTALAITPSALGYLGILLLPVLAFAALLSGTAAYQKISRVPGNLSGAILAVSSVVLSTLACTASTAQVCLTLISMSIG